MIRVVASTVECDFLKQTNITSVFRLSKYNNNPYFKSIFRQYIFQCFGCQWPRLRSTRLNELRCQMLILQAMNSEEKLMVNYM